MTDTTGRPDGLGVVEIDEAECWSRLGGAELGRLAVQREDGGPDIFPVNFRASDGRVFIRSAAGAKVRAIESQPLVAFEVDGQEAEFWWSVVLRGVASRLEGEAEIRASGVRELVSWSPTAKFHFLQVAPDSISGRKFLKRAAATDAERADAARDPHALRGLRDESLRKPRPIPHQAPPT